MLNIFDASLNNLFLEFTFYFFFPESNIIYRRGYLYLKLLSESSLHLIHSVLLLSGCLREQEYHHRINLHQCIDVLKKETKVTSLSQFT